MHYFVYSKKTYSLTFIVMFVKWSSSSNSSHKRHFLTNFRQQLLIPIGPETDAKLRVFH